MFYSIEAVQPTGVLVLDTLAGISERDAFTVWDEIVTDAHNGYKIDMGHRGWAALNAGDVIRLCAYAVNGDSVEEVGILHSQTNSARAYRRRMY